MSDLENENENENENVNENVNENGRKKWVAGEIITADKLNNIE